MNFTHDLRALVRVARRLAFFGGEHRSRNVTAQLVGD